MTTTFENGGWEGRGREWDETKRMVKDPVCGMYMDPRLAVRVDDREGDHYFCSEECRRKFLNDAASRR